MFLSRLLASVYVQLKYMTDFWIVLPLSKLNCLIVKGQILKYCHSPSLIVKEQILKVVDALKGLKDLGSFH